MIKDVEDALIELSDAAEAVAAYERGEPGTNLQSAYRYLAARQRAREVVSAEC